MTRPLTSLVFILAAALAACGAQSPEAPDAAGAQATPAERAAGFATAMNPLSSPKNEVVAAFQRLADARSYRAVIDGNAASEQERLQLDYVAPDRLRVVHAEGVQTIIGTDMYLEMEGRTMKQPVRAGLYEGQLGMWKLTAQVIGLDSTIVELVGSERIDGQEMRQYRIVNPEFGMDGEQGMVWVGDSSLRVDMIDGEAVTHVHYSHINDSAVRVDPPG